MPLTQQQGLLLWSALQILTRSRYEALIQVFGSLSAAVAHLDAELLRSLGCRADTVARVLRELERIDPEHEEELLLKEGAQMLSIDDQRYPSLLRDTADAPPLLCVQGDPSVLLQPCVGMVGTRRMSEYGRRAVEFFTTAFVRAGVVTVSGLARGVDTGVAEETLSAGGKTVAVLGQGMATLPHRSRATAKRIVEGGGCILSEFPLRCPADIFTFPKRNRIIAGLSSATLVLEAPDGSGSLITARFALDEGREVFAVPGQIFDANYDGCNALLAAQRAQIAWRPDDVLRAMHILPPAQDSVPSAYLPHGEDETLLWKTLSTMPQHIDLLIERTGLSPGVLSAILTTMEMMGVARNLGSGTWVRA